VCRAVAGRIPRGCYEGALQALHERAAAGLRAPGRGLSLLADSGLFLYVRYVRAGGPWLSPPDRGPPSPPSLTLLAVELERAPRRSHRRMLVTVFPSYVERGSEHGVAGAEGFPRFSSPA